MKPADLKKAVEAVDVVKQYKEEMIKAWNWMMMNSLRIRNYSPGYSE